MFNTDLYIFFLMGIIALGVITVSYFTWHKFEIAIVLFLITTLIAGFFFDNQESWVVEEVATGLSGYLRGSILLFTGIMGILHYWKNIRTHQNKLPLHLIVLSLFLILSLGSTYYSIDVKNTFFRSSLFILLFLFLLGLNTWLDRKEKFEKLLNILFVVIGFILFINLMALILSPSRVWWWKSSSRFLGLWSHPNEHGGFSIIAYPIILWKYYNIKSNKKYIILIILGLNIFLQILSGSRTSAIASLAGIIVWFIIQRSWIKLVLFSFVSLFVVYLAIQFSFANFARDESENIFTLSEREIIWEGALVLAKEQPILGYGYAVESKIFYNQNKYDTEGTFLSENAQQPLHNGYLSIFIGGGLIGFSLWMLAMGYPIYNAVRSKFSIYKLYAIATLIPILISNTVDTAITGYLSATDIFFWVAWIVAGKLYILEIEENKKEILTEL